MLLAMAQSEEYIEQLVASEALIAATAKKKDASAIINQGMDILKTLYKSKNDHIKVRALVGMCKLGASGGHDGAEGGSRDQQLLGLGKVDCLVEQLQAIRYVCPTPPQEGDDGAQAGRIL